MNIQLRPWQNGDEASLVENANNYKIWINLKDVFPHPYTLMNAYEWINFAKSQALIKAIVIDGKAVGGIGLYPQNDIYSKNAELGYWLGEAYWGKGIVSAAIKEMLEIGFQNPNLHRIFASVMAYNQASMRVLEKAGFCHEATLKQSIFKDGKLVDETIWAILKDDFA